MLADDAAAVRIAARDIFARQEPSAAVAVLEKAATGGEVVERQAAFATLGGLKEPDVDAVLAGALEQLAAGKLPPETTLDLLQAAAERPAKSVKQQLAAFESTRSPGDPLGKHRDTLVGGDAQRGRKIFFERTEVSCVRCHRVQGTGGDVGPELSKIAVDKQREYLLEAIVLPNKAIAKNFETVLIADDSGKTHAGILKSETDKQLQLMTAEGKLVTIDKLTIEDRRTGKSAMPEDLIKHLTPFELRDLVEFLAGLK